MATRWREVKKKKRETLSSDPLPLLPSPLTRLKIFLIDTFMIMMPILYFVIYIIMGGGAGFAADRLVGWSYVFALHAPTIIALWVIKGETPGLKAYNMKLVPLKGSKISLLQALIRYCLTPLAILSVVGVASTLWRKDRKALHDLLSLTTIQHAV